MHESDDSAAQAARAKRLRAEIEELKGGKPSGITPGSPRQPGESDRDFVERRMREQLNSPDNPTS